MIGDETMSKKKIKDEKDIKDIQDRDIYLCPFRLFGPLKKLTF